MMRLFMFEVFSMLNYLIFYIRDFKKITMMLIMSACVCVNLDKLLLYEIASHVYLNTPLLIEDGSKQLSN